MHPDLRAVVFDMDGVLVDSEPLHGKAWTQVLSALDIPMADDWFIDYVGIPDHVVAHTMAAAHELPVGESELLSRKRAVYKVLVPAELCAFPGVVEGLDRLNGIPTAIATSSCRNDVMQCLKAAGILERFPVTVSADDVPRHKPDPMPYLRAAELLGVPPEACLIVEDSATGIAAARAAGCRRIIGVTTSHTSETLAEADVVLPTMAETMAYVHEVFGV